MNTKKYLGMMAFIFPLAGSSAFASWAAASSCAAYCTYEVCDQSTGNCNAHGDNRSNYGSIDTPDLIQVNAPSFEGLSSQCESQAQANTGDGQYFQNVNIYSTTQKTMVPVYANFGYFLYAKSTAANSCR